VTKPKGFKRVGLRYINKIVFNATSVKLEDYFNFYPTLPSDLPQVHTNFISRVEIPYRNNRDRMLITLTSAAPEVPDTIPIILDLDYIMFAQEGILMDKFGAWLEEAHAEVEKTFESCTTNSSKALFGEIE
jgi:uncharacterized protein (TIGR04255 family)